MFPLKTMISLMMKESVLHSLSFLKLPPQENHLIEKHLSICEL